MPHKGRGASGAGVGGSPPALPLRSLDAAELARSLLRLQNGMK